MRGDFIKNEIILILLIIISLAIIVILVPFATNKDAKDSNLVYRSYYLYDENTLPVSLSYEMLEYAKDTTKERVIKDLFNKNKLDISDTLKLKKIELKEKEVILTINEKLDTTKKIPIDCLVNSIIDLEEIEKVIFRYNNNDITYKNNIESYYVSSPLTDKLASFLYKDENYDILYLNELKEEITFKIKKVEENKTTFKVGKEKIIFEKKRDGFYYENIKVLSNNFKVKDNWISNDKNVVIEKIELQEDNTLLVTVKVSSDTDEEIIVLKQGLGLYSYQLKENNNIVKEYIYQDKSFIEK